MLIALIIMIWNVLCVNLFTFVNYTPGNLDLSPGHDPIIGNLAAQRGEVFVSSDWFWSDDGTNWGDQINRHANFQFFWTGFLVLIRSMFGESFNAIMHDLYSRDWGHNRLTCCLECGPILDNGRAVYQNITIPSTG